MPFKFESLFLPFPPRAFQKVVLNYQLTHIFTFLRGASKGFMKAFKAFIKPFEAPQRRVKIKIYDNFLSSSGIGTGRVNDEVITALTEKQQIIT